MSTITIYKTSRIIPGRNLKIDDLETYLSTISSLSFSDFQYIRPKLDGTIKVNLGQEYAFWDSFVFDYLKVVNGNGEKTQYYYITKVEQKSEQTLELTLHMDVINTFQGAYEISPNSVIKREFKDRYEKVTEYETGNHSVATATLTDEYFGTPLLGNMNQFANCAIKDKFHEDYPDAVINDARLLLSTGAYTAALSCEASDGRAVARFPAQIGVTVSAVIWYFKYDFVHRFYPIVDYLSEGIEPQLYKTREDLVAQFDNQSWNLVYKANAATLDPSLYSQTYGVDVFLVPDNPTAVIYSNLSGATKTATDFSTGNYTYFRTKDGSLVYLIARLTDTGDSTRDIDIVNSTTYAGTTDYYDTYIYSDGTTLTLYRYYAHGSNYSSVLTIRNIKQIEFLNGPDTVPIGVMSYIPTTRPDESVLTSTLTLGAYSYQNTLGVQEIGLTDPKLMKVIKLPFPPSPGSFIDDYVEFSEWKYSEEDGMYKGEVTGNAYINRMETVTRSPLWSLYYNYGPESGDVSNKKLAWSSKYEPKLLHSDFYQPKFVYDSFTFLFECEKVDRTAWREIDTPELLHLDFIVTSTVNSRFLFRFPDYVLDKSQSDYDNVLPVSRNNEVTIYSNQYLDYLRNGYNYDVKNKNRQQAMSALNIVGTSTSAVDYGVGYKYGEIEHPGAALFGTAVGAIGKITSNIMAINQAEEAMERKKRTLINQATSVSGSDDIDLLVAYSNNQAKVVYYKPSELMQNALATLFHYCGYVSERRGVPNENTRYWFDYCQADIEFINEKHAPAWALDEIKMRYSLGLTILHNHSSEWDINQEYENWEVSFDL